MERSEPSCTAGGDVDWYSHYGEPVWRFLKSLKIELSYDPAIPPWAHIQRKTWPKKIHAPQ